MSSEFYRCTPRQTKTFVTEVIEAGLVPYIQSSPGMGKSSILRNVAKHFNLHMIDHRLSTSAPEDMSGLPRFDKDGYARFAPFADLFPLRGFEIPEGKDGWLINFDEFSSAFRTVQAAAYKVVLDKMVGQHHLHDRVAIAAAGNLMSDKAIVNPISTAMQSRLVTLEMEINHTEWLEDVALTEKYDPRIIAYLNAYPSHLMDFNPNHKEKTFCCPRTWEFMNKLIIGKDVTEDRVQMYAGTITAAIAVKFIQFTKLFSQLISIQDIVNNPTGVPVPNDNGTKWAMISYILEHLNETNFTPVAAYINRFDLPLRIVFFRSLLIQYKHMRNHPEFINQLVTMSKYLND